MADVRSASDVSLLARLLRQALPFWPQLSGVLLLGGLSAVVKVLNPLPLKLAVDNALDSHPLPSVLAWLPQSMTASSGAVLILAASLLVVVAMLGQVQAVGSKLLRLHVQERLLLRNRRDLFEHAQRLPLTYHDRAGTTDTVYRVQNDVHALTNLAMDSLFPFITAGFTLLLMAYVAFRVDWLLTLIAMGVLPTILLLSRIYKQRLRRHSRQVKELESTALSVIQETLSALRVVRAFGQEQRELDRYTDRTRDGIQARRRLALAESAFGTFVAISTAAGTALVLYLGVRHVRMGILTLGDLILLMGYLAQIYAPMKALTTMPAKFQSSLASAERAFELMERPPALPERADPTPVQRAAGAIVFEDVSFAYEASRPVLHELNLAVEPGMRVGIAGRTGAGKTTLINLLTRLLDPTSGRIMLDGVDLRDYRISDLRRQFAIVLQEPVLFSTTIAQNVAYGTPEATPEQIEAAARAANAHDFISALPEGYASQVGERGGCLSGGERQRICLARAFLTNAPILILDEPTSSVDVQTEASIMEAMERLMSGRTVFMIAHRLSTLRNCDVLLRLDHGRLVDVTSRGRGEVRQALAAVEAAIGSAR